MTIVREKERPHLLLQSNKNGCAGQQCQIPILSASLRLISSLLRSYRPVVSAFECSARLCCKVWVAA